MPIHEEFAFHRKYPRNHPLRSRIEALARERGVDPKNLPRMYTANTLLSYLLLRNKEKS